MKKILNVLVCVLMALSLFVGNATVAYASAPDQKSAAQIQREKAAAERQKRADQQKKQREKAAADRKKEQEKKQKQREAEKLKREKEAEKAALKKQKEEEKAEKDALKAAEKKQKETALQKSEPAKKAEAKKADNKKKEVKQTAKKDNKKEPAKKASQKKQTEQKQQAKQKSQTKQKAKTTQKKQAKKNSLTPEEQYEQRVKKVEAYNKRVIAQQRRDLTHSIGAWGYFGYSALFQNINSQTTDFAAKTLGGVGGGFGLGYQLRYEHFLFNTGLELEIYNSASRITSPDAETLIRQYGMTPYPSMTYQYEFSNFIDKQQAGYVQLPLLFGGEWGRYYFLAGPKIGMGVWGTSAQKATLTTTITDSELAVPLDNMYNHALTTDKLYEGSDKLSFGLNVGLAFEAGIYLDEWLRPQPKKQQGRQKKNETSVLQQLRYRIGVYADYGLLSVQQGSNITSGDAVPVHIDINNMTTPLDISTLPSLSVPAAQNAAVNPFEVGVKVAIFYDFPKKQRKLMNMPAEPAPTLIARVVNEETGEGVQGAMVNIYNAERDKTINKTTNRQGYIQQRIRKGEYQLSARRGGFYNSDTITVDHQKNAVDTFTLSMLQQPVPENYYMTGFITDAETKQGLEAQLQIFSIETRNVIYSGQATDDGLFVTDLPAGTYIARMTMQGYMPKEDTLRFEQDTLSLVLTRVREGKKMVFHNMYFATGKTRILPESEPAFEELTQFLQENPDVNILITGHTDNIGTDASNQRLSEGRANAVRRDLIMRGVDAERIETDGKGESEPIADNETDEGRAQNRRIEVTVVGQQQ